jgi:DNA-binding CsgD family transcriptional regulator
MTTAPTLPGACPILIGRSASLDRLARSIEQSAAGNGHSVLIAGEAGIGKSRLVAEAKRLAAQRGFQVVQGCCYEPDALLPYAPLRDLLRVDLSTSEAAGITAALDALAPYLSDLVPELAARLPRPPLLQALVPDEQRRRMVQAFVQFFLYRAAGRPEHDRAPLLVVVEDLHWCDETSLDVLLALSRRCAGQPILLVGTYRDDELSPALAQLLAALERERLCVELHLERLPYHETDAMLRAIFRQQRPIRSDFLGEVFELTEGNPFFVEEVLKSLVSAGAIYYTQGQWDRKPLEELNIPRTIQAAIQQRAASLSPQARHLLALAAVAGRRFDFTALQRSTGQSEAALLLQIKELIAAQLVIEETDDSFTFRHALTRKALYNDLLTRERRALHRALAHALEALMQEQPSVTPESWLADLASHCFCAQDWPKAYAYARRAAEKARPHAPRAAIEHLAHALEAARRLALPPDPTLSRARGQLYETLGDFEQAQANYQAAIEQAQACGDRRTEWQAMLDLGFLWAERDYRRMGDYRQRALALARTLKDPLSLGQSLNRVGNWYLFIEQPHEALRYHQEALEIFQRAHDQAGLAATYDLLGVTHCIAGDIAAGIAPYEQAIALFRALDDSRGLASSLMYFAARGANLLWTAAAWPVIPASACIRDGEEALRLARQIGWRAGEAAALVILAYGACPRGAYGHAIACAQNALAITHEIEHNAWHISAQSALGATMCDLLALEQARRVLEQALEQAHGLGIFFLRNVAALLGPACIAQRDFARAREVLTLVLAPDTPMQTQGQRLCWAACAELELAMNQPAAALDILNRLIAAAAGTDEPGCIPRLWHLRGEALAALGRSDEAAQILLEAAQDAQQRELRPLLWRIQVSLGKLAQRRARRKQAAASFASARALIGELGAGIPDQELRTGFLRKALALLPQVATPTARRSAKAAFDGLTGREREIAGLIAQGRINREIAELLVVGERTVETHISNILSKLGFNSRRQIAAWAVEKGLAKRIE